MAITPTAKELGKRGYLTPANKIIAEVVDEQIAALLEEINVLRGEVERLERKTSFRPVTK